VTLTCNKKSLEIFKLSGLGHVVIKVEAYRAQAGLTQCCSCQNSAMSGPTAGKPPSVCGVEMAVSIKSALRRAMSIQSPAVAIVHWYRGGETCHWNYCGSSHVKEAPQKGAETLHGKESNWESILFQVHNSSSFLPQRSLASTIWVAAATTSAGSVADDRSNKGTASS
jgi:hypothetical protein